MQQCNLMKFL